MSAAEIFENILESVDIKIHPGKEKFLFFIKSCKIISFHSSYYLMSQCKRFLTMWYVRPAKPQISLRISDQSLCYSLEYSMIVKLLTEQHSEFLSLKRGCRGSSESTLVKMSNCWKSHAAALICLLNRIGGNEVHKNHNSTIGI